ncbi:MAG: 2-hydroxyacyl-CoA dehydratase subunit D [Desulfotomaculales bacterium]
MNLRAYVSKLDWQKHLRNPRTYGVLEILTYLWRTGPLDAHRKAAFRWGLQLLRRAYRRERPVVWTNVYTPPELIWALGGLPFMPEVAAAVVANLGRAPAFLQAAQSAWYSTDLCSFHRCSLGLALTDLAPRPDLVLATGHLCDGAIKFLEAAAEVYGVPFYVLHVPYGSGVREVRWLADEMEALSRELRPLLGGDERLRASVARNSNLARRYLLEINELRTRNPTPWSGQEALTQVAVLFMAPGTPGGVQFYRRLCRALHLRVRLNRPAIPRQRFRLLWLHFRPYYPGEPLSWLERERHAVVTFEEVHNVTWDPLDPHAFWPGLAARMLANPLWGPARRRAEQVLDLVRRYRIDGVVHFSHWGCRQSNGAVPLLQSTCTGAGVPFLNLEGDCIDARNAGPGQMLTRLQAFLEVLEGRKSGDHGRR